MVQVSREFLTPVKIYSRNKSAPFGACTCPCLYTPTQIMCTIVLTGSSWQFHNLSHTEVFCSGHYGNRLLTCTSSFQLPFFSPLNLCHNLDGLGQTQNSMNANNKREIGENNLTKGSSVILLDCRKHFFFLQAVLISKYPLLANI